VSSESGMNMGKCYFQNSPCCSRLSLSPLTKNGSISLCSRIWALAWGLTGVEPPRLREHRVDCAAKWLPICIHNADGIRVSRYSAGNGRRMRTDTSASGMPVDSVTIKHEYGSMRRSTQVDRNLKIGFYSTGTAWADAPAGEKPDTFVSRALKKAGSTSSAEISGMCRRWALQWIAQNGHAS
jgi:hypothetical protein